MLANHSTELICVICLTGGLSCYPETTKLQHICHGCGLILDKILGRSIPRDVGDGEINDASCYIGVPGALNPARVIPRLPN